MRKILSLSCLTLLSLLFLSACDKSPPATMSAAVEQQLTTSAISSDQSKTKVSKICKKYANSYVATISLDSGAVIDLCGFAETLSAGVYRVSAYELTGAAVGTVAENGSELESFQISIGSEKEKIVIAKHIYFSSELKPFTSVDLTCTDKACKQSKPKCVFDAKSKITETYLEDWKRELHLDTAIANVAELALQGNKKAMSFFEKNAKHPFGVLDGAAAEAYQTGQDLIAEAKSADCLK